MPTRLARLADALDAFVGGIGHVAAWSALALVLLVAWNVLGRYLFGISSVAAQEAEWHLLAVVALFGMAYGLNQGGEVRVDVFYDRFGARARAGVDLASAVALLAICVAVVWLSVAYVIQSWRIGEGSPDPGGLPNRWLLKATIQVAFALLGLQAAAMALRAAARLRG